MPFRSFVSACLLFVGLAALTSCSGSTPPVSCGLCGGPITRLTFAYSPGLNNGNAVVFSVGTASSGTGAVATLAATVGTADAIFAMQTDGAGTLYVMTAQNNSYASVGVYTFTMSGGTLTPVRSFSTVLPAPMNGGMALSKTGKLYISAQDGYVYVFPTTASGSTTYAASTRLYHGFVSMTTDPSGNIYGTEAGYVYQYTADFASITPTRTINVGAVGSMAADSTGRVFVSTGATSGTILSYAAGSTTPTATLSGTATGLQQYAALFLDSSGNLWASNPGYASPNGQRTFEDFSSFSGNVAPQVSVTTASAYVGSATNPSLVVY